MKRLPSGTFVRGTELIQLKVLDKVPGSRRVVLVSSHFPEAGSPHPSP